MTNLDKLLAEAEEMRITHPYFSMADQILLGKLIAVAKRQGDAIEALCFNHVENTNTLKPEPRAVANLMRAARADVESIASGEGEG